MGVKEQANYMVSHPLFRQAINNYLSGKREDLTYIMIILQKEAIDRTRDLCVRTYMQWKGLNYSDIIIELRRMGVPLDLDARMPMETPDDVLVSKFTNKSKHFGKHYFTAPNQLSLFVQVA
jgi:hypothetical protein